MKIAASLVAARRPPVACAFGIALLVAAGCSKSADSGDELAAEKAGAQAAAGHEATAGVALKPQEVADMGITTVAARAVSLAQESTGFGVVIAHETIALAVADLASAIAVNRQSRAAWERTRRLSGTPGALPADTLDAAERQMIVDHAALELAQRRLSSTFGLDAPWKNPDDPQLSALASGLAKLVRVTFPLGSVGAASPRSLRLAHINSSQGGKSFIARQVWSAPADAAVPGKSFFAYLKENEIGEGERLLAWAPSGAAEPGVEVPAAAAIISAGKYWCYVEQKPGRFVRVPIDPDRSTVDGYFVGEGIAAGDKIVVAAAGQLLARELNPSSAAD